MWARVKVTLRFACTTFCTISQKLWPNSHRSASADEQDWRALNIIHISLNLTRLSTIHCSLTTSAWADEAKEVNLVLRQRPGQPVLDFSSPLAVSTVFCVVATTSSALALVPQSTWLPSSNTSPLRFSSWLATLPVTTRRPKRRGKVVINVQIIKTLVLECLWGFPGAYSINDFWTCLRCRIYLSLLGWFHLQNPTDSPHFFGSRGRRQSERAPYAIKHQYVYSGLFSTLLKRIQQALSEMWCFSRM